MRKICDLDIKKYRCVTPDIRTSEVIITDERIRHIQKRQPNDFERFSGHLKEIVEKPDYIIADERPNTALVLRACLTSPRARLGGVFSSLTAL